MGSSLLTQAEKTAARGKLDDVWATFAQPFQMYVAAQQVTISTSPTFSMFGDHSQNAAITVDNTAVTPKAYTVTGCILFGNRQPWPYMDASPELKLRNAEGTLRVRVDATGDALMRGAELVTVDGFDFTIVSTPRPHGLLGAANRWTYTLQRTT